MREHAKQYPISTMCRVLEVSVSGYDAWLTRQPSAHSREDGALAHHIHRLFYAKRQVYGSPRVQADLRAQGFRCSRERTARLMREMELVARPKRRKAVGTKREPGAKTAPNLLDPDFRAQRPNAKWVSDTTSVWTAEGWVYVAAMLDLSSRLVVGWAMGENHDEDLVRSALEMALLHRRPPAQMLLPSDQGSPYSSRGYLSRLEHYGSVLSRSRTGDGYDNAAMESFLSTLKGACVHRAAFQSRAQARQSIFEYIACLYHRERRHSPLNSLSPLDYEPQME